jgi:hypothetical protein
VLLKPDCNYFADCSCCIGVVVDMMFAFVDNNFVVLVVVAVDMQVVNFGKLIEMQMHFVV